MTSWKQVCTPQDLVDNSGVCALVDGKQIALFKVTQNGEDAVYAIDNYDPFGQANVLYRGLVASVEDKTVVASPLYKQRFCLSSGKCLDDENLGVTAYPARINSDSVELGLSI